MATITVDNRQLEVALTPRERIAGLHRNLTVPLSAVTGARLVNDPMTAVRGLRAPGLSIPGRTRIGTWRGRGHRTLVVARKDQPALVLELAGHRITEVIVSLPDAAAKLDDIRSQLPSLQA